MMNKEQSGFSVVELTVGMLAASMLAVTVCAIFVYGFSGWTQCNDEVELQRLGAVAARKLDWTLRGARRSGIVLTNSSAVVFRMTNDVWAKFYQDGDSLRYCTNVVSGGPDPYVVQGKVVSFQCVMANATAIGITLRMTNTVPPVVTQQVNMVVFPRN